MSSKVLMMFQEKQTLIQELLASINRGERCFVTSNTKANVESLSAALAERFGPDLSQIVITSGTGHQEKVQRFIANARTEILNYQVTLTSPSLGTGVDITFAGNAQLVDAVFGFCEANITTHFEFDQQLARVRHPKVVRVWISPRRNRYETNVDVIRKEILDRALYKNLLIGYDSNGEPEYMLDDPFIEMAALITSEQRASKNDLQHHFLRHKEAQGYRIQISSASEWDPRNGDAFLNLGRKLRAEGYADKILKASPLPTPEFKRVRTAIEGGSIVSDAAMADYTRTAMEVFYRAKVTPELIALDDRGRHRGRVILFQDMNANAEFLRLRQLVFEEQPLGDRAKFLREHAAAANAAFQAVRLTPLMNEAGFRPDALVRAADLGRFTAFVVGNKAAFETLLGHEVRRDIEGKPVMQLNLILKAMGLKLRNCKTLKREGEKIYVYRLDFARYEELRSLVERRRLTPAWAWMAQTYGWDYEDEQDHDEEDDRSFDRG